MPEIAMERLREGQPVADVEFDKLFPEWARRLSVIHWTPVAVARRAAELLAPNCERILDIGSGVGKLCLVGALTSGGTFYGIEQQQRCIDVARAAATRAGATRAHFLHGNMTDLNWGGFDGYYLYNPFVENLWGRSGTTDDQVERDPALFHSYVKFVTGRLRDAPLGCRVVTYHGFGGDMPSSFEQWAEEQHGTDVLELWVKTSRRSARSMRRTLGTKPS
jgi:SAM-dependent methyltransferase